MGLYQFDTKLLAQTQLERFFVWILIYASLDILSSVVPVSQIKSDLWIESARSDPCLEAFDFIIKSSCDGILQNCC